MARAFSLLCLALIASSGWGQTFGRFGYGAAPSAPGWTITPNGFRAEPSIADTFLFPVLAAWKPKEISAQSELLAIDGEPAGGPSLMRCDLWAPGFSLYFPNGIDLKLQTTGPPFLSWPDGSVGQTVPTPATPWVLVSFRTEQPPVLMSFVDPPVPMEIEGEAGGWHLKSEAAFNGWVRFVLPLGEEKLAPVTASGLGDLTKRVAAEAALWSGAPPKLVDTKIAPDQTAITVTWTFDKPGALVPKAALLASFGGDPIAVTTKTMQLSEPTSEGPVAIALEPNLAIRFPRRPWPGCRYVAIGGAGAMPPGNDLPSVVSSAFAVLSSSAGQNDLSTAGSKLMSFLGSAHGDVEPATGQKLPYAADGTGYDLTSANALLTQTLSISNDTPDLQNPLLTDVLARIDAYSWMPANMTDDTARRGAGLTAITLAMRSEPDLQLESAMLQAGMSAERGLDLWRYWRGDIPKLPPRLEPLEALRKTLFSLKGPSVQDPLTSLLFSPIGSCGPGPLAVAEAGGKQMLTWTSLDASPGELQLGTSLNLKFAAAHNLAGYSVKQNADIYTIHFTPKAAGACGLELVLPSGAKLPASVAPLYVETSR